MAIKLTGEQVDYIRAEMRKLDQEPKGMQWQRIRELAVQFKVNRSTISEAYRRTTWLNR